MEGSTIEKATRGGYVLIEEEDEDLTIVSTGSEVSIAVEAAKKLQAEGIKTRIVSLPCWLTFDQQDEEYRLGVLRSGAPILSLEAASTAGWQKYSHEQFGLSAWGASGPYLKVYEKFGITGTSKRILSSPLHVLLTLCRHCRRWQEGRRVLQVEEYPHRFASSQGCPPVNQAHLEFMALENYSHISFGRMEGQMIDITNRSYHSVK